MLNQQYSVGPNVTLFLFTHSLSFLSCTHNSLELGTKTPQHTLFKPSLLGRLCYKATSVMMKHNSLRHATQLRLTLVAALGGSLLIQQIWFSAASYYASSNNSPSSNNIIHLTERDPVPATSEQRATQTDHRLSEIEQSLSRLEHAVQRIVSKMEIDEGNSSPKVTSTSQESTGEMVDDNRRTMESLHQLQIETLGGSTVELYNGDAGCKLENNFKFIANGMTGHAFAANLVCPHDGNHKVVMKLQTGALNMSDREGLHYYKSYDSNQVGLLRQLNDAMMKNATKQERDWVVKNLIIPIGEVMVDRSLLYEEMNALNQGNKRLKGYKGIVNATDNEAPILGSIYPYTTGAQLERRPCWTCVSMWRNLTMEHKQGIVRDLVHHWKYMYEHNVLHCELFDHIYYSMSEKQTSVIDFQSHKVIPHQWTKQMRDDWQRRQLLQLLNLIGNICSTPPDARELNLWNLPFRVEDGVCTKYNEGLYPDVAFVQQVVNATGQWCTFNPKLPWNHKTRQSYLNDTAQVYRDLSDWSNGIGTVTKQLRATNSQK